VVDIIAYARWWEIFESTIPPYFYCCHSYAFLGRSIYMMMVVICITAWSGMHADVLPELLQTSPAGFCAAARLPAACPFDHYSTYVCQWFWPRYLRPLTSFGVALQPFWPKAYSVRFSRPGVDASLHLGQLLNQAVQFLKPLTVWAGPTRGRHIMTVFAINLLLV